MCKLWELLPGKFRQPRVVERICFCPEIRRNRQDLTQTSQTATETSASHQVTYLVISVDMWRLICDWHKPGSELPSTPVTGPVTPPDLCWEAQPRMRRPTSALRHWYCSNSLEQWAQDVQQIVTSAALPAHVLLKRINAHSCNRLHWSYSNSRAKHIFPNWLPAKLVNKQWR
jgi:hypothetical protein